MSDPHDPDTFLTTTPAWIEASTLGPEASRETWALAARHLLADVAGEYHAVIGVAELARAVQERSRIRTRAGHGNWMGDVLYRVTQDCLRRGEPLLGSLCIGSDARMGDWYADTVTHLTGVPVADPEQHAANERLECYRRHGAELPPGGGEPALPPRPERRTPARAARAAAPRGASSARSTPATRAPARAEKAPSICPQCFMALPATGVCDTCG